MNPQALIPVLVATAAIGLGTGPATATAEPNGPVEVTTGRFQTLPGGADLGYDVKGGAIMFRSDSDGGTTTVTVRVHGLDPDTTYSTHVHNAPCSNTPPGGGHYQDEIGGPVDAVNEIWPTIATDSRGHGVGHAVHAARARADAQAIVIHWPGNPAVRLACLDLG